MANSFPFRKHVDRYKSFKDVVKTAWDRAALGRWAWIRLHQKLKCLKDRLKESNKSTFGNVSQIKENRLQKIQEIDSKEAEEDLYDIARNEEAVLKRNPWKSQLGKRLNGDRRLETNGCKNGIIILNLPLIC